MKRRYWCTGLCVLAACGGGEPAAPTVVRLAFAGRPSTWPANTVMAPSVLVTLLDDHGNLVISATNPVTIGISSGPVGSTLAGTTTVKAVYGIASFKDLSIAQVGEGYSLVASSPHLSNVTSAAFGIFDTLSPPAQFSNLQLDSTTLTIGGSGVPYSVLVLSGSMGTMVSVFIQASIEQGAVSLAAGGAALNCGQSGDLPAGNCLFHFTVNAPSTGGTLVAGPATARFELRQWLTPTRSLLLDSAAVAVTLAP